MTYKSKDWEDVPNILNGISWQLKCIAEQLETYNQSSRHPNPNAKFFRAHFEEELLELKRRVVLVEKAKVEKANAQAPDPMDSSKLRNMLAGLRT